MKCHKMLSRASMGLILCAGALMQAACLGRAVKQDVHGVSKATAKVNLPPESDTYTVIGWQEGLKGYVVKYNDSMYRDGKPTGPEGARALKELGIRTIISLVADEAERKLAKEHGFRLVELTFDKKSLSREVLDEFTAAIKNNPGPFYVHCNHGPHRAGTLMLHYRIGQEGWPFEKAVIEFGRLGGDLKADHPMLEVVRTYAEEGAAPPAPKTRSTRKNASAGD